MAIDSTTFHVPLAPQNARSVSAAGLEMLKCFTPFCARRIGAPSALPLIGYGHVCRPGDTHLQTINELLATALLREDLRCIEIYLNAAVRVPLEQHEFDALASLVFDVGIRTYERSFLRDAINRGDRAEAASLLMHWVTPDNDNRFRRGAEATMFLRGKVVTGG